MPQSWNFLKLNTATGARLPMPMPESRAMVTETYCATSEIERKFHFNTVFTFNFHP